MHAIDLLFAGMARSYIEARFYNAVCVPTTHAWPVPAYPVTNDDFAEFAIEE